MIHVTARGGPDVLARFPLSSLTTTCGCYVVGTVFYVLRVPEKQISKIFDVWVGVPSAFSLFAMIWSPLLKLDFGSVADHECISIQGASHQIFHILVATGQIIHLLGLKRIMLMHNSGAIVSSDAFSAQKASLVAV